MKNHLQLIALLLLGLCLVAVSCIPADERGGFPSPVIELERGIPVQPSQPSPGVQRTEEILKIRLRGHIFIGDSLGGKYFVVDLASRTMRELKIGAGCEVRDDGIYVICEKGGEDHRLVVLNLQRQETVQQIGVDRLIAWKLPPDQTGIYFWTTADDGLASMFSYDFLEDTVPRKRIAIDMEEWLTIPVLSKGGKYLAGVRHVESMEDKLFVVEMSSDSWSEIETIARATWNLAWSPADQVLAYGLTDIDTDVGYCMNYVGIYDADLRISRLLARSPAGKCYDDFEAHFANVWSPDSSYVGLVLENNLCVIPVRDELPQCYSLITDGGRISRMAWSPDSHLVAYLVEQNGKYQLGVYDLVEHVSCVILPNIVIMPGPGANVLVWSP